MTVLSTRWKNTRRIRLIVGYLLLIVLLAAIWGWSVIAPLNSAIAERQQRDLLAVAQAGTLILGEGPADAKLTIDRLVANTDLRMTLFGSEGQAIADSGDGPPITDPAYLPEVTSALEGRIGFDRRVSPPTGPERVYVAVPLTFEGQSAALSVSESHDEILAIAASGLRFGILLLGVASLIAVVVVHRLTRLTSEPISRLSLAAKSMASGDLSVTVAAEDGDLAGVSAALADLREQMKRRIEDLQAERHNLRTVLDGLTDAVFLLREDEIQFANSAAGRLFRAPTFGWRGLHVEHAPLPASVAAAMLAPAQEGVRTTECGPDASGTSLRVAVIPLNPTERLELTLVVISDITERTRVDQIRRDFVANASHELKTPAAAIQLLAESASDAASDGDTEQAVAFATQIVGESRRLSRLVSDLLELSRLEGTSAQDAVTDIREVLSNTLLGHRTVAAQRGLSLEIDDSSVRGVDLYARADPTDVAVAFDNLLDNAIKYTETGGVTVSLGTDGHVVHISFTDTGIGIPLEDLPRIFERFYRVDRARSRAAGSTGLGLSLVRHVIERSNGSINVTSEPEIGSTFTVSLSRTR